MAATTYMLKRHNPPTEQEKKSALDSIQILLRLRPDQPFRLCVVDGDDEELIELPPAAAAPLIDILEAIVTKQGITVTVEREELTTERAAEILNVSHPFLIKLLDEDKIPYRKVGPRRRVRLEDVMAYKEDIVRRREAILDQLVADAQEQGGMGYD